MHPGITHPMNPLELVNLSALMELTNGRAEVAIGLIDGPVAATHPDFAGANIREVSGKSRAACSQKDSFACKHGTFVASILVAKRGSPAPAICPGCTLLIRPIFTEPVAAGEQIPSTTPEGLATAIIESIEAGADVLNLSAALAQPSPNGQRELEEALDYAARRGVIVIAAAGNQGAIGSTPITRHPWVIPVIACDREGRPIGQSNLGNSIGRRGLSAPGDRITGLGTEGPPVTSGGTSVAAPFVTGAIALLWSAFPAATAGEVKFAATRAPAARRGTVVPPLLDAWAAYGLMKGRLQRR